MLEVKVFTTPPIANNTYVIIDSDSHEAIMVDCSKESDEIMDYVKKQGAKLKYIVLTHAHFDHVLGVRYFQKKYHVPVYGSVHDKLLLSQINDYMAWVNLPEVEIPQLDDYVEDMHLTLGEYPVQVLSTPGHTQGSVCYLIQNMLFSGDTLFKGTYGRTDFPGGDAKKIKHSLHLLFDQLPDDTIVYPGHGAPTTLGEEKILYQ